MNNENKLNDKGVRFRHTKKQYAEHMITLLEILKSAGRDGISLEQILTGLNHSDKENGEKNLNDPDLNEEAVGRMFMTLKQFGCNYTYVRGSKKYRLEDEFWTFPQELTLTPMDQLALKLGWEVLESSVDFNDVVGRLKENKSTTFKALGTMRFSFFHVGPKGKNKVHEHIMISKSIDNCADEKVLFNVFMAWKDEKMVFLHMKSGEEMYFMPSKVYLAPDGWIIEGEKFRGKNIEKIQLYEIKTAKIC